MLFPGMTNGAVLEAEAAAAEALSAAEVPATVDVAVVEPLIADARTPVLDVPPAAIVLAVEAAEEVAVASVAAERATELAPITETASAVEEAEAVATVLAAEETVAAESVLLAAAVASVEDVASDVTEAAPVEDVAAASLVAAAVSVAVASLVASDVAEAAAVASVVAAAVAVAATEVAPASLEELVEPSVERTVHCFTSTTCGLPLESVVGVRVITQVWVMPFSLVVEVTVCGPERFCLRITRVSTRLSRA